MNVNEFIEFTDQELEAEINRLITKLPSYTPPPKGPVLEDLRRLYKTQMAVWIRAGKPGHFCPFYPTIEQPKPKDGHSTS